MAPAGGAPPSDLLNAKEVGVLAKRYAVQGGAPGQEAEVNYWKLCEQVEKVKHRTVIPSFCVAHTFHYTIRLYRERHSMTFLLLSHSCPFRREVLHARYFYIATAYEGILVSAVTKSRLVSK